MSEELDNAVSSLLGNDSTQTTETPSVETPNEKTQEPAQADNSASKPKTSKYDVLNKNYSELRSSYDRKNQEYSQKIQALEKRLSAYAPYEAFLPELQKALEEKRRQEQAQQFQQNPLAALQAQQEAQRQAMEQMLNERLAPFQQEQARVQNESLINQNIEWMKSTYGEEAYNEVSPYMGQLLQNAQAQYGTQVSDLLARNPEHLFVAAFGQLALNKIREYNQTKQAGSQNKAQLAQQSAGISRPNRVSKTNVALGNDAIEQAAYDFLRQNS
jgi:HSP90 family molecular chaperone